MSTFQTIYIPVRNKILFFNKTSENEEYGNFQISLLNVELMNIYNYPSRHKSLKGFKMGLFFRKKKAITLVNFNSSPKVLKFNPEKLM